MSMPDERTVDTLLDRLAIKYDIDPRASTVLVNGRDIDHLDGMETCLGDGDLVTITVTPPAD